MSNFPGKSITKVEGSKLLALRGGGPIFRKKALRNTSVICHHKVNFFAKLLGSFQFIII